MTKLLTSFGILFIASLVRISYIDTIQGSTVLLADASGNFNYAMNLLEHNVFSMQSPDEIPIVSDSYRTPGYAALVALIAKLVGLQNLFITVYYFQALLGGLTAMLIFLLGMRFLPHWASIGASILFAISPHSITIAGNLLTETTFAFLLLLGLSLQYLAVQKNSWLLWILAGSVFGLCYLVNPIVFFLPFLLLVVFYNRGVLRRLTPPASLDIIKLATFISVFLLFPIGWGVRNMLNVPSISETGTQSLTETGTQRAVENIIMGAHPEFYNLVQANVSTKDFSATFDMIATKKELFPFLQLLLSRVVDNPGKYLTWYAIDKPRLLWKWDILWGAGDVYVYPVKNSPYTHKGIMLFTYVLMKTLHPWILLITMIGAFMPLWKKDNNLTDLYLIAYIPLAYFTLVYVIFNAEPRYSIPFRPELYLSAIFTIATINKDLKKIMAQINSSSSSS